jgi:Flp pilus assembly protein TadG
MQHSRPRFPAIPARYRRGITLIITAMMLTLAIPLVGLAIDAGTLYSTRAKIQSAADAASMAAARSLAVGLTLAAQEAVCKDRATEYFKANFPPGSGDVKIGKIDVAVTESGLHVRTVNVMVEAAAPVFFMHYLGFGATSGIKVNVIGETSRRDVNLAMVLDRSGSLQTAGSCDDLEAAAIAFTAQFANQRDRIGLVTFGGSHRVDYPSTKAFKDAPSINSEIEKLFPGGCAGYTGSAQAIWVGYEQVVAVAEPGALNVIVFFTDGRPNTITANWPVKTLGSSGVSRCYDWGNATRQGQAGWNPAGQSYLGWTTSSTAGPYDPAAGPIPFTRESTSARIVSVPVGFTGPSPVPANEDCYFRERASDADRDFAYMPDTDVFGNSIFGWLTVDTYSAGHPYAGKAVVGNSTSGENAAINALDNAASRIRQRVRDPNIDVVVYAIGLGDVGAQQHELLRRVANDRLSTVFDSSAPEGKYVFAPTAADLSQAFAAIASEIMRFSK